MPVWSSVNTLCGFGLPGTAFTAFFQIPILQCLSCTPLSPRRVHSVNIVYVTQKTDGQIDKLIEAAVYSMKNATAEVVVNARTDSTNIDDDLK